MKQGPFGGSLNVLSEESLAHIHETSLQLLHEHGMQSNSDLILDIFKKAGARVDMDEQVIRLSREMVEAALESSPSSFVLYGREESQDLLVEPGRVYYGMGGTSEPFFWDYDLKIPRSPTKQDMVLNTRIGQAAENVDFIMSLCSASDMPTETILLHEYDAIFRNSTKPVIYTSPGRWHTQQFLAMAIAASGGESAFRERPSIVLFTQPVSPMQITHYSDGIVDAIELGVPVMYSPGPMMGATSPATLAGTLAQVNAEALMGITLAQLIKPGTPVIYAPNTGVMDMRSAQCTYGSAEQTLARAAVAQLGRYYDLPIFGMGGGVESKLPDAEAAAQSMMGLLTNAFAGITLTQLMGTLGSGLYGSREMVLICDEMVRMIKRILSGIDVRDATLAADVIKEVGYGGEFLTHPHTVSYFRQELFFPQLFRRQSIDQWKDDGARPIVDVAHDAVEKILASAGPVDLPAGADEALVGVLNKAVGEAAEKGSH